MKLLFSFLGAVALCAVLAGSAQAATANVRLINEATPGRLMTPTASGAVMMLPQVTSGRSQVWVKTGTNPGFATFRNAHTGDCLTGARHRRGPGRAGPALQRRHRPAVADRRRRHDLLACDGLRAGGRGLHGRPRRAHRREEPALDPQDRLILRFARARPRARAGAGAEIGGDARRPRRLRRPAQLRRRDRGRRRASRTDRATPPVTRCCARPRRACGRVGSSGPPTIRTSPPGAPRSARSGPSRRSTTAPPRRSPAACSRARRSRASTASSTSTTRSA